MSQPHSSLPSAAVSSAGTERRTLFGIDVLKWVFALEYALQGLVNPFQGATYQPFFRHLRVDYGLSEAATQNLFAKSYLAWSVKPIIGFLIDAFGRTRTLLIGLLLMGTLGFVLTPLVDRTALVFFGSMFLISVAFAATDVAVDRATVIAGEEESRATGRSKSTTVGLNQAICWMAVYGTGTAAAMLGGYLAEHVQFNALMVAFAVVPVSVLLVVLRLPRDRAQPLPLRQSVMSFWNGLNSGPIMGVMAFYFIFNFQPAMGALWTEHLIANLHFTQTEVGVSDGMSNAGYFFGVLIFAWKGVHWQDRYGMKRLFRLYIVLSVVISLTQYLLVDPWFSGITARAAVGLPFLELGTVRLGYLCGYNFIQGCLASILRMSTFSLVGAVVPVAAAGSLFAGFMSVANLAAAFSYSSGAWLYEHGARWAFVREAEQQMFGVRHVAGEHLSISMLLLVSSLAYVLSFVCVHVLPDQRETAAVDGAAIVHPGPERWQVLPSGVLRAINWCSVAMGLGLLGISILSWELDVISGAMMSFFTTVLIRKVLLDALLGRQRAVV
jgi:MFS family permease